MFIIFVGRGKKRIEKHRVFFNVEVKSCVHAERSSNFAFISLCKLTVCSAECAFFTDGYSNLRIFCRGTSSTMHILDDSHSIKFNNSTDFNSVLLLTVHNNTHSISNNAVPKLILTLGQFLH